MLSDGIATSRGRSGAMLHRDQVNGVVKGRRGARLAAITSGGAIPETADYTVIAEPDEKTIGTIDEDFAVESLAGDVISARHAFLANQEGGSRARARRQTPTVRRRQFRFGWEKRPAVRAELSAEVADLRQRILTECGPGLFARAMRLGRSRSEAGEAYVQTGAAELGATALPDTVVAERFFDQAGGMQLVLHAPFGSRINRAWGLALRKRFCRTFNFELQAAATDNGLVISFSEQHAFPAGTGI